MNVAAVRPAPAAAWVVAASLALAGFATMAWALHAGVAWPRLAVLLVAAPLVEETVFRAGLQERLLRARLAPWQANALTALAFGAAHVLAQGRVDGLAVMLPALFVGALYARGRRLAPCVACHAAMNAAWLAWGLAGSGAAAS